MSCPNRVLRLVPGCDGMWAGSDGKLWRRQADGSLVELNLSARPGRYVTVHVAGRTRYLHQLILEAFHGPRPPGMVARHLNGDRQDNGASGLCWGTKRENAQDAVRHGRVRRGEAHPFVKLNRAQVAEAREERKRGVPVKVLARRYGVSPSTMNSALSGKTWAPPPCQTPDDGGAA